MRSYARPLPVWPRFRSAGDVMRFEPGEMRTFDAAASHHCGFWQRHYPDLLPAIRGPGAAR